MTEQEKQKLKDALIEAKHIHSIEYNDEDAFVGICFSDLVDIINSVMYNTGWRTAENSRWIPVEKTNNTINVFFSKEQDGWHTYTQYGIDLPTSTAIEFGEHIAKAVNLLNGKGVTNG